KVSKPKPRRIDGIRVPSAQEMDRALAWVSFHLKLLGLQGGEVRRLRKRLKKHGQAERLAPRTTHVRGHRPSNTKKARVQRVPRLCLREYAKTSLAVNRASQTASESQSHAHEDVSIAPEKRPQSSPATERGPP
ncbi:hypothetical protein, partial [Bremerella alba]|uniref:hypothetical protein n=1 Tax=Bremerella alba TaxID=980252 RepID=UPI001A955EB3